MFYQLPSEGLVKDENPGSGGFYPHESGGFSLSAAYTTGYSLSILRLAETGWFVLRPKL